MESDSQYCYKSMESESDLDSIVISLWNQIVSIVISLWNQRVSIVINLWIQIVSIVYGIDPRVQLKVESSAEGISQHPRQMRT